MIQYEGLHHVNLLVTDLEQAKVFYKEILCLCEIEWPPFDFPRAWYSISENDQQQYLIEHDRKTRRTGGIDTRD